MATDEMLVEALNAPDNDNGAPFDMGEVCWLQFPYYSDAFGDEVVQRFQRHIDEWESSPVARTVWNAYRAYHNLGSSTDSPLSQLEAEGEMGELLALAIPHYRSLVKHQIALFTAERPAWDPMARTSDSDSAKQVPMAVSLLDHVASTGTLDPRLAEQCEMMMTAGAGYFVTGWDDNIGTNGRGWFTEKVFAPWEITHERVRTYHDASWWITRDYVNRWNWVAKFKDADPEKARRIAESSGMRGLQSSMFLASDSDDVTTDGDRIAVLTVMIKPSLACPVGRLAIIAEDGEVLMDGAYPYGDEVTISRMCASEFLGTSMPYCDSWGVLAAGDAYNAIISMMLTRIDTCGVPNFCVPENSELEYSDIAGGNAVWKLPPGSEKPSVIDLLNIPDVLPAVLGLLKGDMEQTVGINSVTRGQPQENVSSGSMAALLQSMAIQFNSNLERAWILNLEKIGTDHLRVFQQMASDEMSISVCGEDNKWTTSKFRGEDVRGILRVSVKTASALSKTVAGRVAIADKLMEMDKVTAQEYMRVIQTGQLDPMFSGPVSELTCIKGENERLARGEEAHALTWDNHQLHIREHKILLNSELRENPQAVELVQAHLQEHFSVWADMSRKSPDMLAAIGCPPLPQAAMIGASAMAMQDPSGTMAQGGGGPPPGPAQQKQPETEPQKAQPGPKGAPKGREPSQGHPSEPKVPQPARNPMNGEAVV